MRVSNAFWIIFAVVGLGFLFAGGRQAKQPTASVEWIAVNVNAEAQRQADAHLIRFPNGHDFLIDAGRDGKFLVPALKNHGVKHLDGVIITHTHKDHYGGLLAVIDSGVSVGTVFRNLPSRALCHQEVPWGCDLNDVDQTFAAVFRRGIPVKNVSANEKIFGDADYSLDVLAAFTPQSGDYEPPSVNDMSLLMRLSAGNRRILFTGDLDSPGGDEVLRRGIDIRADVLKAPHHGCEGFVSVAFLAKVDPRWIVVPAPASLWNLPRCRRLKDFAVRNRIPVLVSGIDGEITFQIAGDEITVSSEHGSLVTKLSSQDHLL